MSITGSIRRRGAQLKSLDWSRLRVKPLVERRSLTRVEDILVPIEETLPPISDAAADQVASAVRAVLDAACEAMPVGFSVKVRLGIEDSELLDERVELLNGYPLDEVIVHPRTAVQMYEGRVDVEAFARVLPRIRHRVVYNGDLYTVADVARIRERFPEVTHLMLGRGLVTDPFLPERLRGGEIAVGDAERRIKAFLAELLDRYEAGLFGPSPVLGRMKEVWGYLH